MQTKLVLASPPQVAFLSLSQPLTLLFWPWTDHRVETVGNIIIKSIKIDDHLLSPYSKPGIVVNDLYLSYLISCNPNPKKWVVVYSLVEKLGN